MRLLLAEDEEAMAEAVVDYLEYHHYEVDWANNGIDALERARMGAYDVLILDIMMPGMDGLTVLRTLRGEGDVTPVLLLTAKGEIRDKVQGFESGSDDYLTKPFAMEELRVRVDALTRRGGQSYQGEQVTFEDLALDKNGYAIRCRDKTVSLSHREYHLIEEVYVIENSKNITADLPTEVETGSGVNITLIAPYSQFNSLSISIDENMPNYYNVKNGEFRITISDLQAGYHKISVKYHDLKVAEEAYSNTFTVNVCSRTVIEVNNMTTTYNSNEKLVVSLKDSDGNAVKGKEIAINLNGINHTATTDDNGKAELAIDLIPGEYTAEILFAGAEGYFPSSANASIIVNKIGSQIIAPDISTTFNVAKNLVVTLKDDKGNVLAGQNVIVELNGKVYNKTTDANGQVKISVNLPARQYFAKITFAGNGIYKSSAKTVKATVKKATPKLTASSKKFKAKAKTKKVTVKFKSNNNKVIKNSIIKLTVNKKTYKAKTNSKGTATFKVKLTKKGKYRAVFKYAGNSNYKSISKKIKITIK